MFSSNLPTASEAIEKLLNKAYEDLIDPFENTERYLETLISDYIGRELMVACLDHSGIRVARVGGIRQPTTQSREGASSLAILALFDGASRITLASRRFGYPCADLDPVRPRKSRHHAASRGESIIHLQVVDSTMQELHCYTSYFDYFRFLLLPTS